MSTTVEMLANRRLFAIAGTVRDDAGVPVAREGDEDHTEVGQHGDEGDRREERRAEPALGRRQRPRARRVGGLRHHRVAFAAKKGLAERV